MKYARVFVEPTADSPNNSPFCVDVIVDDNGEMLGKHALFGLYGWFDRARGQLQPFVLGVDGRLDWGDHASDSDRQGSVDLRDGPVLEGRLINYRDSHGPATYRIKDIVELPVLKG